MATPSIVRQAHGSWQGQSRLNLPWLPEAERISESASTLQVASGPLDTFATITYTWEYEDVTQEGVWILAGSKMPEGDGASGVTGAWTDSWHQNASIMGLVGIGDPSGGVRLAGEYSAPEGPNWGWRLELELMGPDELEFRMINITPDGQEEWAQHGQYRRA